MLRIAVCDDDVSELSNITSLLSEYAEINVFHQEITYTAFRSALELIAAVESGNRYEIILLDILMPRMSGLDAAREIRTYDKVTHIIFLTSSPDFAVDSYAVDAFYYALKPIWKDQLFAVLDKAFAELHLQSDPSILVKCKTGLTRIPLHMLEYTEIIGRTIYYHLVSGIVLEETGVLAKLEQTLLAYPQFAKPHRAYIVNLDCIDVLMLREIRLNSHASIPLAKANYAGLKERYLARTFQRGGENICSLH